MTYSEEFLMHHGIKGQKWGVRRFQNADGSLTNKGKSRYRQGKEISREHQKLVNEKYDEATKRSTSYRNAKKEYDRLTEKYNLDRPEYDDGSNPMRSAMRYNERKYAEQKRWSVKDDIERMDKEFYEKAEKYADKQILEKYGDVGVSNMKHYQNVNAAIAVTAMLGAFGAMQIYSSNRKRKFDNNVMKVAFG